MSDTITVTDEERLIKILSQLRPGDEITYEASGGGREGKVDVHISEVGEAEGTYCIFGTGNQEGEYVIFPYGRPSGHKYDPPEACYINGERKPPLSNLELHTHGTIEVVCVDKDVIDGSDDAQRETRRRQLTDGVASILSAIDEAEKLAAAGSLADAKSKLKDLKPYIDTAEKRARQHDFGDLSKDITTLKRRRKSRLKKITERIQTHQIPEEIPQTPTYSVDYDDLTDRELIGAGGNADVSKAIVSTPDGAVPLAIKEPRLSGTLHSETVDRLLDEAETWNKIDDHDHIVDVVDYGSTPMAWIAMEYMDGGHLGRLAGDIDISRALWTAIAVTKGVRHAHRHRVAHLDLKPQNVLFRTVQDAWDVPKVADWGLSKRLLDHSNSIEGLSPYYAAPEQFDEEYGSPDDITDIYQLGAVFYELFTGQPPFEGEPFQVIDKVKNKSPTPPTEIVDVPEELDNILLTALAKEKDDRYDNIIYLRDALQNVYQEQ